MLLNKIVFFSLFFLLALGHANAQSGIFLSSSSILIDKGEEESSVDVKNKSSDPILLYSKVVKLPDDDLNGGVLYTAPQATLINPGESQTIRVFYKSNLKLEKEHMARIIFTGLPPKTGSENEKIKIIVGHELPVVIGFTQSIPQNDIWGFISWNVKEDMLCMSNPTKKVFRFDSVVYMKHSKKTVEFTKPYLLPGENLCGSTEGRIELDEEITISTMSDYNYKMQEHTFTPGHH